MPWILAVVSDLMFTVKIQDAAKRAGATCVFVGSHQRAIERLADHPALVILDLDFGQADPIALIPVIHSRHIPTLGYLSHVHIELRRKAEEAGCKTVIPRSVIAQKLPDLIASSLA
jgi:CheY-like chemotaxis protein